MRHYKKHEFCKAVECIALRKFKGKDKCMVMPGGWECLKTARDFHRWLDKNGFVIMQPEKEGVKATDKVEKYEVKTTDKVETDLCACGRIKYVGFSMCADCTGKIVWG